MFKEFSLKPRYLEYSDGSSSKFYSLAVVGTAVNIHFGRIGTAGQSQTKQFGTATEASNFAEKQIASKLAKGYRELAAA